MIGDVGQVIGREVELARDNLRALCGLEREAPICGQLPTGVVELEFGAVLGPQCIVEGCQDDRRAELPFVDQIARALVVRVDASRPTLPQRLIDTDVEVVRPLRRGRVGLRHLGRRGGVGKLGHRLVAHQFERRRREISRVA